MNSGQDDLKPTNRINLDYLLLPLFQLLKEKKNKEKKKPYNVSHELELLINKPKKKKQL